MAKYDTIGKTYNETRSADSYLTDLLYLHLDPKAERCYLDIGCGSGNYTSELHKKGLNIIGIDPSIEMLQKARLQNPKIDFRLGAAEHISIDDSSLHGIVAFLTIHHWTSLEKGIQEVGRVLKTGSPFVLFHSTPRQMQGYWLNEYFPKMMKDSMRLMPQLESTIEAMNKADISLVKTENYTVKKDLQDLFLYCGKYEPKRYFRTDIRNGISSFAAVAFKDEVSSGLEKLRNDIASERIKEIMNLYDNKQGDYLFIVGVKN